MSRFSKRELGARIKFCRERYGMSRADMAAGIDVAVKQVSDWERGYCAPRVETLWRIAEFFNVSLDSLTGYCSRRDG